MAQKLLKGIIMVDETTKDHFLKTTGNEGESEAERYLKKNGFKIVERNFSCRSGEIDIMAEKKGELHFIEVKTRRSLRYGDPLEAITPWKQQRMFRAAHYYLHLHPWRQKSARCFSVMSIYNPDNEQAKIEFIPNAFEVWGNYY